MSLLYGQAVETAGNLSRYGVFEDRVSFFRKTDALVVYTNGDGSVGTGTIRGGSPALVNGSADLTIDVTASTWAVCYIPASSADRMILVRDVDLSGLASTTDVIVLEFTTPHSWFKALALVASGVIPPSPPSGPEVWFIRYVSGVTDIVRTKMDGTQLHPEVTGSFNAFGACTTGTTIADQIVWLCQISGPALAFRYSALTRTQISQSSVGSGAIQPKVVGSEVWVTGSGSRNITRLAFDGTFIGAIDIAPQDPYVMCPLDDHDIVWIFTFNELSTPRRRNFDGGFQANILLDGTDWNGIPAEAIRVGEEVWVFQSSNPGHEIIRYPVTDAGVAFQLGQINLGVTSVGGARIINNEVWVTVHSGGWNVYILNLDGSFNRSFPLPSADLYYGFVDVYNFP